MNYLIALIFTTLIVSVSASAFTEYGSDDESTVKCTICENVVNYVEDFIEWNRTEQEIIQYINQICILMPTNLQAECSGIIETYGADIIELVLAELSPDTICEFIGVCPTLLDECKICIYSINYIDECDDDNEIDTFTHEICDFL